MAETNRPAGHRRGGGLFFSVLATRRGDGSVHVSGVKAGLSARNRAAGVRR